MVAVQQYILYSILAASVSASPIQERQTDSTLLAYSLPISDNDPVMRAAGVETKRATFTYGPAVGTGPFSPDGALGAATLAADTLIVGTEYAAQSVIAENDSASATVDTDKVDITVYSSIHEYAG